MNTVSTTPSPQYLLQDVFISRSQAHHCRHEVRCLQLMRLCEARQGTNAVALHVRETQQQHFVTLQKTSNPSSYSQIGCQQCSRDVDASHSAIPHPITLFR